MKAKNLQEIKSLTAAELGVKLNEAEEKLFRISFRHAAAPVKNPLEIRNLRRQIARVKTFIREKEISSKKTNK